ncbi:hypothetical protein P8610_19210 [Fictibacillus sp. UD]
MECKVRDSWGSSGTGETPNGAKRRGGSPHAPRKASTQERRSTTFKNIKEIRTQPILNRKRLWPA